MSDTSPDVNTQPEPAPMSVADPALAATKTTLARRWTIRVWIIALIGGVMFLWGLFDAAYAYPQRGKEAAEYLEYLYLRAIEKAEKAGKKQEASVDDPDAELKRLEERRTQNILTGDVEVARMNWLEALRNAAMMSATNTKIDNWRQTVSNLDAKWGGASAKPPAALEAYDLPVQWLITLAGLIVLGWRLFTALPVMMKKRHEWDPATSTLTLPSGDKVTPQDVVEYDKRKWDKFIVVLGVREGHPTLSGQKLKIDTYVVNELEPWILEMERLGPVAPKEDEIPSSELKS